MAAELPALLDAVHDRTGRVVLVGFHRDAWDRTADQVQIAGQTVRLEGFSDDEPHTVLVIGSSGRRLTLMVVAPDTSEVGALEELVARSHSRPAAAGGDEAAESQSWVGELVARLASMEGQTDELRTQTIERWAHEAALPFIDAPVQAYVPILVEHIVREQITTSSQRSPSKV